MKINRSKIRKRIHRRVRKKISGTLDCPRLSVYCSNRHIVAQLIDDSAQKTLCSVSTLQERKAKKSTSLSSNVESAKKIGSMLGDRAKQKKISKIIFDRGGNFYHGKVKALADSVREKGMKF